MLARNAAVNGSLVSQVPDFCRHFHAVCQNDALRNYGRLQKLGDYFAWEHHASDAPASGLAALNEIVHQVWKFGYNALLKSNHNQHACAYAIVLEACVTCLARRVYLLPNRITAPAARISGEGIVLGFNARPLVILPPGIRKFSQVMGQRSRSS